MQTRADATTTDVVVAPTELRYLVLAAQREGNRQLIRQLNEVGLTPSQAEVLIVLADHGPMTLKALGGMIVCEAGSPSRIVDNLVGRDLVARHTAANDRRAVDLSLTDEGSRLVPPLRALDEAIHDTAISQFSTPQLQGLVSALRLFLSGTESEQVLERRFADSRVPAAAF